MVREINSVKNNQFFIKENVDPENEEVTWNIIQWLVAMKSQNYSLSVPLRELCRRISTMYRTRACLRTYVSGGESIKLAMTTIRTSLGLIICWQQNNNEETNQLLHTYSVAHETPVYKRLYSKYIKGKIFAQVKNIITSNYWKYSSFNH